MPSKQEIEYGTIAHLISILGLMCAASPEKITDLLTEYLFDEEGGSMVNFYTLTAIRMMRAQSGGLLKKMLKPYWISSTQNQSMFGSMGMCLRTP